MKLWTLQHRDFTSEADSTSKILAPWDRAPENWRVMYRWMAAQWRLRMGQPLASAPIWCWHSCNGKHRSPPSVGTASCLLGDWSHHAASTVLIEADVPDNLVLLSSYWMWNEAMADFTENRRTTIESEFTSMFDEPLLKHSHDDIQAVVGYLMTDWIIDIRPLPKTDADFEAEL